MSARFSVLILGAAAGVAFWSAPVVAQSSYRDASKVEVAIRGAAKSDRDLKAFYATRANRPLWLSGGALSAGGDALLTLMSTAQADGIDPEALDMEPLIKAVLRLEDASPKTVARTEVALSRAYVRYASAVATPRDVGTVYFDRELNPRARSASELLGAAATAPSLRDHVAGMRWMNPAYPGLRRGLTENRDQPSARPHVPIPTGPSLKIGSSGERVSRLRYRLGVGGGAVYDRPLSAAVAEFQAARGLPVDGSAGPQTILALNEVPADRDRTLRINLERARALPSDPGRRYILVDAANARLYTYENGRVQDTMKVIVGKPSEKTPMLAGLLHYAIVNPYWNIPPDLARTKVAPGVLSKGVKFLKKLRYEVLSDWTETARVVDPKTIDWTAVAAGRQEVRVRQLPGKDNSMGRMKFMMPNDLGIYLHDTPDKHLFADANRYFSSGCVRLEDAPRLARWLFGKPLTTKSSAPEQRVELPEPVPVYITYLTAAPSGNGIAFRSDPYGLDAPGARQQAAAGPVQSGREFARRDGR